MTPFQIVATLFAGFTTLYFGQVAIRTKTYAALNWLQIFIWVLAVIVCVISWVGIK